MYGGGAGLRADGGRRDVDVSPCRRCPPSSTGSPTTSRARTGAVGVAVAARRRPPARADAHARDRDVARLLVLRGDVLRAGRQRPWTPVGTDDNAPYQVFHDVTDAAGRHAACTTRPSCSTTPATRRRAPPRSAVVPPPLVTIEAPAEGSRVREGRGARRGRPRAGQPRRDDRAQGGRRRLDGDRHRLHRRRPTPRSTTSGPLVPRRRRRSPTGRCSPPPRRRAGRRARSAHVRATRAARSRPATLHYFRPAGDYGGLGPAPVGRRGRPGGARADRLGQPVAAHPRRGRLGRVRHPAGQRRGAGQLHHAPARRRLGAGRPASPAATAPSCRSTTDVWIVQGDPTVHPSPPTP